VLRDNFKVKKLKGHLDKVTELFISKGVVSGQVIAASTYSMVLIFFECSQVRVPRVVNGVSRSSLSLYSQARASAQGVRATWPLVFIQEGPSVTVAHKSEGENQNMGHLQLYL